MKALHTSSILTFLIYLLITYCSDVLILFKFVCDRPWRNEFSGEIFSEFFGDIYNLYIFFQLKKDCFFFAVGILKYFTCSRTLHAHFVIRSNEKKKRMCKLIFFFVYRRGISLARSWQPENLRFFGRESCENTRSNKDINSVSFVRWAIFIGGKSRPEYGRRYLWQKIIALHSGKRISTFCLFLDLN